ncbi:MAG TPA: PP2C family protein-serine/threonine phosphatase [Thermoanaerobaculia bacterium]|jgi:serine phosphatase RsbU (regulator of sigma subunit)|nr:PP2C family protein-serine/threonine phosphatase [Thermoanaerobaculia bacterium]
MDLIWSIDDVVRTSDEDAARRRFAKRNRAWLTFLLIFFAFATFIAAVNDTRSKTPIDVLIAVAHLGLIAFGLFVMRYAAREDFTDDTFLQRAGAWVRRHISAVSLAFIALQYPLALYFGREDDAFLGWVMTIPLLMMGFRMLVPELVLLHGYLAAGALIMMMLGGPRMREAPLIVSMLVINGIALSVELLASRRMRRLIVSEWTSRRTQAREQVRMRDELRYARELQLSMLPEFAPDLAWADICSISVPATEVGGDYYDYFVEGDSVALVCIDVAGHGMASGLVLAALRSGFTLLRDSLHDPAAVLQRLHTLVAETSRRRMLVTASVVLLDQKNRRAIIASAGNPPVFIRRAGEEPTIEVINLYAPPLGVRLPVEIPQRQIDVAPGDVIVLHSDGIYETRSANDEVYGLDRIATMIREQGGGSAESLRDALLADVAAFRGTREQDDDVTLVVCRLM